LPVPDGSFRPVKLCLGLKLNVALAGATFNLCSAENRAIS
jgi:hypothetical protein